MAIVNLIILLYRLGLSVPIVYTVPGVKTHTRQSIGLPTALSGPGELEGGGEGPRAASPDPGRLLGNPVGCRVCAVTPGILARTAAHARAEIGTPDSGLGILYAA